MNLWSDKYEPQAVQIKTAAEFDVYIAGMQTVENAGSAHAFQINYADSDQPALVPQTHVSLGESRQERAYLSGVVGALQSVKPGSTLNVICRLENVVQALKGHHKLRANADILTEIEATVRDKSIKLNARRAANSGRDESIIAHLLELARTALSQR